MRKQTIERLLPTAYQRAAVADSVLSALLEVMEALHAPDEEILADVDALFSAYSARQDFLPFLASWVTLDYLVGVPSSRAAVRPGGVPRAEGPLLLPAERVRDLIANAASLAQVRGAPLGLTRFLTVATGVPGFAVRESTDHPFQFVVEVPEQARGFWGVIGLIVEHEKPAAATFSLSLVARPLDDEATREVPLP
ncbi:MAG: hypothetical protein ACRDQ7_23615 [Haloechinothrix sp.]